MSIGQRILQARQEAGLSQRQLAGAYMTRNMLSAIEHDKANPSLETLVYLAGVLGKPVGFFLGEKGTDARGFSALSRAREAFDAGAWKQCLELLKEVPGDDVTGREKGLMELLAALGLAREAVDQGKRPYARELLGRAEKAAAECPYFTPELERRMAILKARAAARAEQASQTASRIPDDEALTVKAGGALTRQSYEDAKRYLLACDSRDESWHFLMGEALFGLKAYAQAAEHYHAAEEKLGKAVWKKLELCYAGMKDFEKAYRYATMT